MKRFVRRPFKGSTAYEWQIGMLVFQIPFASSRHFECYRGRLVHVWRDPYWKFGR